MSKKHQTTAFPRRGGKTHGQIIAPLLGYTKCSCILSCENTLGLHTHSWFRYLKADRWRLPHTVLIRNTPSDKKIGSSAVLVFWAFTREGETLYHKSA